MVVVIRGAASSVAIGCSFWLGSVEARAAEPAAGAIRGPVTPCDCAEAGDRLHDGFFARADTGLSLFRAHVSRPLDAPGRSGIRGIGQSTAISIGGTPAAGLVVGGQIAAARIDPSFVENGVHKTPDDDSVKLTLARIGPFATWYPELRGGFHVNAALALAFAVESDDKGNPLEPGSAGPALSVALGHDWFVASELSLGLLARATFSVVTRERADRRENVAAEMVEFALSYTYH